jgi:hypothetical protein
MMADNKEQRVCVKFCFLLGKRPPRPPYSPDLAPCDFFPVPSYERLEERRKFL